MRRRNPERQPEVNLLILSEGGDDDSEGKSEYERRRRAGSANCPKAQADGSGRGQSEHVSSQERIGLSDHLAGPGADRQARPPGAPLGWLQTFLFFASQLRSRLAISAGLK